MALKNVNEGFPPYLAPLVTDEIQVFAVVPFFFKQDLKGIISLGFSDSSEGHFKNLPHVRKLADQVAIAVSNAQLMEDLNQLNWGTLTALARTVDAKSPWTAGHTERVTQISGEIGRVLGLTPDERVKLHKAALLHDIGKIGVPAIILDKPGRLTDKEFRIIQRHPRTGARILEPIAAYAPIMPIVLQHHERFDGSGYPEGLSGKQICLGARILAVADVYDALTSERPYRAAMTQEQAIDIIQKETGRHFDPDVVKAFLQVVGQEQSALGVDETKKAHIGIRGNVVNFPVTAEKASPTGSG
jgi:putative nucleotidyltransferase with HDIG domain